MLVVTRSWKMEDPMHTSTKVFLSDRGIEWVIQHRVPRCSSNGHRGIFSQFSLPVVGPAQIDGTR